MDVYDETRPEMDQGGLCIMYKTELANLGTKRMARFQKKQ